MKIAVFGAGGQLGRCFRDIQQTNKVRNYIFFDKKAFDIADPNSFALIDAENFDLLINCAAYTAVDLAETEREIAYRVNVKGPGLLAQYGKNKGLPLIHFSTDYVYGEAHKPIKESHQISPSNYYGQTKWEGELAIRESGGDSLIFRTSWLYSPYENNFVKTMLRLAENHQELRVVNDQRGSPTYAGDLVAAIDQFLHANSPFEDFPWGTYNFANRGSATWYSFASEILKNHKVSVFPVSSEEYPTAAKRPSYSVLDVSKFEKVFNRKIPHWRQSLRKCLNRM